MSLTLEDYTKMREEVKQHLKITKANELKRVRKNSLEEIYHLFKGDIAEAQHFQSNIVGIMAMLSDSLSDELKKEYGLSHPYLSKQLQRLESFFSMMTRIKGELLMEYIDADHCKEDELIIRWNEVIKKRFA